MKSILIITVLGCLLLACGSDRNDPVLTGPEPLPAVPGVRGTVEFWKGDFMPTVPPDNPGGTITPVARTIFFFEPTRDAEVVPDGPGGFFSDIQTKLIDTVRSDSDGYFAVTLPSGLYSLFVWEDDRYYANLWSDQYIQPVRVVDGQVSEVRIKIDYLATY